MVEGCQGSGYRTRTAFGIAFRLCGAIFNPARALVHVLFLLEGRSGFLAFVANRTTSIPEPRLPDTRIALRRPRQSLSGGASGTPNLRRCRIRPARFSPDHVLPRDSRSYGKGNSCSSSVASNVIRQKGSGHDCRYHLQLLWWPCIPGGCTDGTPNLRISVRFRFCPGRSQRPLLLSVRIHHVHSPVVKALSNPWYRLVQVFSTSPFRANHASTGCWRRGTPNASGCLHILAGSYPARHLRSLSHFRVTTFIWGGGPPTRHAFRHSHWIHHGF